MSKYDLSVFSYISEDICSISWAEGISEGIWVQWSEPFDLADL